MRRVNRFICLMLTVLLSFSVITLLPLSSYALGSYVINGKTISASDASSTPGQCWAYANAIYKKIWGVNFVSQFNTDDNMLRDLADEELTLTAAHLKEYVTAAALGSSLRVCNAPNLHANDSTIDGRPGHNQIIVQKDEDGFTVIQGGLNPYPYYAENYYTWEGYINTSWLGGYYHYIKYIKWPDAPSYAVLRASGSSTPILTDARYPSGTLLLGKPYSIGGVISSVSPMNKVTGQIVDMNGEVKLSYTKKINSTRYSIASDGMDSAMKFGTLTAGGYCYKVYATDNAGRDCLLLESFFTVAPSKVANEEKIYNFMLNNGFNRAAACAVLANIEVESNFTTTSTYLESGGYNSYGLCQWNLSRLSDLENFCSAHGYSKSSLEGQLYFMLDELENGKYQIYRDVFSTLKSVPDTAQGAYDAAYIWCVNYEIPANKEAQGVERGNLAKNYFERYTAFPSMTVSFNSRGGTNASSVTASYGGLYGGLPSPAKENCTFVGWYTMPEGGVEVNATDTVWANANHTLYAHWTGNTFGITYVLSEGTVLKGSYQYGVGCTLLNDAKLDNNIFIGWYASPDFEGEQILAIGENEAGVKVFYAKWRPYTGLSEEDGGIRYYRDGVMATGWTDIDGSLVYFYKSSGLMKITSGIIGAEYFYLEPFDYHGLTLYRKTDVKNGLVKEDGGYRYYDHGVYQTGWQNVHGNMLFFLGSTGLMCCGKVWVDSVTYEFESFMLDGHKLYRAIMKNGFYSEDGGVRYYEESVYATGWKEIEGYLFYFNPSNGYMRSTNGVIGSTFYCFEPIVRGDLTLYRATTVKNGLVSENGKVRYYVDDVWQSGWLYFDENAVYFRTSDGYMTQGTVYIDGKTYEFVPFSYQGLTLYKADYVKEGFFEEDGGVRLYENGEYVTGWRTVNGRQMFFDLDSGKMVTYNTVIGSTRYEFESFEYEGLTLYAVAIPKNGLIREDGGVRFYEDGTYVTGWHEYEGHMMYFRLSTGLMMGGKVYIDGRIYEFQVFSHYEGAALYEAIMPKEGLVKEDGGVRFYKNGSYVTGWQEYEGHMMYFRLSTGLMMGGKVYIDGRTYQFQVFAYYEGTALYEAIMPKQGLVKDDDGVRFYKDDVYQTGWQEYEGHMMFFRLSTGLMLTQRAYIEGKIYTFEPFGVFEGVTLYEAHIPKNGFYEEDGGIRHYVNDVVTTGMLEIGESLLYFDLQTGLMATENRMIGGVFRCFESFEDNGLTLWRITDTKNGVYLDDDGVRYYINGRAQTGWQTIAGWQIYFLEDSGLMCRQDCTIGGIDRVFTVFDYNGVALYGLTGEGGAEEALTIDSVTRLLNALANSVPESGTISNVSHILDLLAI